MPKVKMTTGGAGPAGTWQPGQVIDCSDEMAETVVRGKYGVLVEEPASAEPEDELMALSNEELLDLCRDQGITGLPARPTKVQLVGVLRSHGYVVEAEPEPETAELSGGETAAETEAPQPRERVASEEAAPTDAE